MKAKTLPRILRDLALKVDARELRLGQGTAHVWGIVVEFWMRDWITTLVIFADGSTSVYVSDGPPVTGMGAYAPVRAASLKMLAIAEESLESFAATRRTSQPEPGHVRFFARTVRGTVVADAEQQTLMGGGHPLTQLFNVTLDVLRAVLVANERHGATATRAVKTKGGPPRRMQLMVREPPDYALRVVADDPGPQVIERIIRGLRWSKTTVIYVFGDNDHWLEVFGSSDPGHGFGATFRANQARHPAASAPENLDVVVDLLQSYAAADDRWMRLISWDWTRVVPLRPKPRSKT